jgi:hypothetical protein
MHVGMETHDSLMDLSDHASRAELHRVGDRCRDADTLEGAKACSRLTLIGNLTLALIRPYKRPS